MFLLLRFHDRKANLLRSSCWRGFESSTASFVFPFLLAITHSGRALPVYSEPARNRGSAAVRCTRRMDLHNMLLITIDGTDGACSDHKKGSLIHMGCLYGRSMVEHEVGMPGNSAATVSWFCLSLGILIRLLPSHIFPSSFPLCFPSNQGWACRCRKYVLPQRLLNDERLHVMEPRFRLCCGGLNRAVVRPAVLSTTCFQGTLVAEGNGVGAAVRLSLIHI